MGAVGRRWRAGVALLCVVAVLGACTEEPPGTPTAATSGADVLVGGGDPSAASVVEQFAGEQASFGAVPDAPATAEGEPVKVGLINQEDVPIGSFPEVRLGALTAAAFINAELGGVDGRPLEIIPCIADFSVEGSQACAQRLVQEGVVAVAGGIDITSNGSIPVLEQNELPYVGGIPVNYDELQSPVSFQFSGGSPGAMVAFADNAVLNGADSVAVVYADFPPVKAAALDYGVAMLEARGVERITEVAYPITATDMLPVITQATEDDPDAILMFAADAACVRTMQTVRDLGVDADLYLVGSCAAPSIIDEAGDAAEGAVFNIEGPFVGMETGVVDGPLYAAAAERYGEEGFVAQSAGTVTFRSIMNLWMVMEEIVARDGSAEAVTPASIIDALSSADGHPSFDGHAFTCDGEQLPGLPAACAPQQVLVRMQGGTLVLESDGWVDVPALVHEHLS
jgi:branched-chain amino acid transport system substrate-binding protein